MHSNVSNTPRISRAAGKVLSILRHLAQVDCAKILRELKESIDSNGLDRVIDMHPISEWSTFYLHMPELLTALQGMQRLGGILKVICNNAFAYQGIRSQIRGYIIR